MNIGLYFGSFNPIHIGHLIIANHVLEHSDLDKIWFVVSPQNPLKPSASLLNEYDRLYLTELAIEDNPKFRASNIEFYLPRPSFTIDTLTYLQEKFPLQAFRLIMGSDSYQNLPKWKNYELIKYNYSIAIYNRPGFIVPELNLEPNVQLFDAPLLDISSSFIREQIRAEHSVRYLLTDKVNEYITKQGYYK